MKSRSGNKRLNPTENSTKYRKTQDKCKNTGIYRTGWITDVVLMPQV